MYLFSWSFQRNVIPRKKKKMLQKIGKVYCISDFMVPLGIVIKTTVMVQILLYQYDHSCEAESSTAYFDIKVYSLCQKSTFLQIATRKFFDHFQFQNIFSQTQSVFLPTTPFSFKAFSIRIFKHINLVVFSHISKFSLATQVSMFVSM